MVVDGEVEAEAHHGDDNTAIIKVGVNGQISGDGEVWAEAYAGTTNSADITVYVTAAGNADGFDGDAFAWEDGMMEPKEAEIVVGTVDFPEKNFAWIDWEWCEDCESEDAFVPVAPLARLDIPRIEGCPVETAAAAAELGLDPDTIQVAIGNALALNPTVQPCEACAALVDAASILRDQDGLRMAAILAVFNQEAPANLPFDATMSANIATAFAAHEVDDGSQYATALEYIDAFVEYVAVLDAGFNSPVGDSVAFVMEKYGADISGSDNPNIAAYLDARLGNL